MKQLFSLLAAILILAGVSCSKKHILLKAEQEQNQHNGNDAASDQSDIITPKDISDFFTKHLSNPTVRFHKSTPLMISQIKDEQKQVWEAWKKANDNFSEEKLMPLATSNNSISHWLLPENLEPHANMQYAFWANQTQPPQGFPLFLYLHGSGDPDQEWNAGKLVTGSDEYTPAAYFMPKIPNTGDFYRWYQKSKQFAWEKLLRLAYLSGKIDPNKIFIYGFSEGGYGAHRLGAFYADYLAGAAPMAGGEPLINAPAENYRNIAFFMLTGANDYSYARNLLVSNAKAAFDQLHAEDPQGWQHYNIQLEQGKEHNGLSTDEAFAYLLACYDDEPISCNNFSRNPYPKKIVWEDFNLDGNHRAGFYNLVVKKRPHAERTRYKMDIQGNQINLTIDDVTYQVTEYYQITNGRQLPIKYAKAYSPSTNGTLILYLNDKLVDLSKEIVVHLNGKQVFKGKADLNKKHLINSCAIFFDPERLYPGAVEVSF